MLNKTSTVELQNDRVGATNIIIGNVVVLDEVY